MSFRRVMPGALALLLIALLTGPLVVAALPPEPLDQLATPVGPEGAVVRISLRSRQDVPVLASLGVDIWKVEREQMVLIGVVGPDLYSALLSQGFTVEVDEQLTRDLLVPPGYPCYRTVEEVLAHMATISDTYPQLTELVDYGDSWEKVQDPANGYDIMAMRITNEAIPGPKPILVIVAEHHARETVVPEIATFFIDYLTSGFRGEGGYGIDPDVTWLVDYREIWVVPLVNPDGRKMVEPEGWWWRKNTNDTINPGCAWPPTASNHYGVDINRNYSYMWAYDDSGSSPYPCEQGYRGVAADSEPETQAIEALGDDVFPNPSDATGMMLTLHSAVPALLVPWSYGTPDLAPDDAALRAIACKWATYNFYPVGRPGEILWYYPNGTTDDWFYGDRDVASFTYEIGEDFFESCPGGEFPWIHWEENLPTFVHAAKIVAPDPYVTAYGPDAHTLAVTPDLVPAGVPVQLTATIEDHRVINGDCSLSERPVAAAEYFVDAPGTDGTGTPLAPTDGSWDEIVEQAQATVDTSALTDGKHYILVHGQSVDGYWGPFTAVFLVIVGQCQPVQILDVLTATAGCSVDFSAVLTGSAPFSYAWDFGPFGTSDVPSPTVDFGQSGTYPYTLTVSNCVTGTDTASGTVSVTCCTEPYDAVFTYNPPDPLIGEDVTFTGTASGTVPISYTWDFGDDTSGSGAQVTHAYTAGGDYTVVMTASNACGQAAASQVVSVCRPATAAGFFWSPPNPLVGEAVAFTGTASGTTPISYTWNFGDGATGSGTQVTHTYAAGGDYTVVMTASNRCGQTVASQVVSVCQPATAADFIWSPLNPLIGEDIAFTGTASGTMPISYTWDFDDGATGSGANPSHRYDLAGLYTVVMTATNCGGATSVATHDVLVVACEPVDIVTVSPAISGCVVTFTAELTGTGPFEYLWAFGDGVTSTLPGPGHDYGAAGSYTVTLDAWNCSHAYHSAYSLVVDCTPQRWYIYLPLVVRAFP